VEPKNEKCFKPTESPKETLATQAIRSEDLHGEFTQVKPAAFGVDTAANQSDPPTLRGSHPTHTWQAIIFSFVHMGSFTWNEAIRLKILDHTISYYF